MMALVVVGLLVCLNQHLNAFFGDVTDILPIRAPDNGQLLVPYHIEDLMEVSKIYLGNFGILVYDPTIDGFLLLENKPMQKNLPGFSKLISSFERLTSMLRNDFPERFHGPESPELGKYSDFDFH